MGHSAPEPRRVKEAAVSLAKVFDGFAFRVFSLIFIRYRAASLLATLAIYAAVILAFGEALAVSSNYFVILPLAAVAIGYGALGGLVGGLVALPANLLLFGAIGHPEYSPASKLIAELSGVAVGLLVGRLSDYFREVDVEIKKRVATEEELRKALEEKELLLRELNHRVKNNLSVIKSLVQLQRSRSEDPAFLEATGELIGRIFAISLVHDQLDNDRSLASVDPAQYLAALVSNIESGLLGLEPASVALDIDTGGRLLQTEAALSLGLIVNEVLTNAFKHALPSSGGRPAIRLSLRGGEGGYRLVITDEGPGPADSEASSGLGLKIVHSLARNLGGTASLEPIVAADAEGREAVAGARFELVFPELPMEFISSGKT
jgi:two-component sensor histidine kinase